MGEKKINDGDRSKTSAGPMLQVLAEDGSGLSANVPVAPSHEHIVCQCGNVILSSQFWGFTPEWEETVARYREHGYEVSTSDELVMVRDCKCTNSQANAEG